jgi:3-oxoacyl-[acyl-carrier protein] reductase
VLLDGKNAVIYGAAGSVGSAVARAFAREGAAVFLAGRTLGPLTALAEEIGRGGAIAEAAIVDALDEEAVIGHADAVAQTAGSLDVSFNAIAVDHLQGISLADLSLEEVVGPVAGRVATHLLTARAAGRHMAAQGRGVVLTFTADAARLPYPDVGSFGIACAAVEGRAPRPDWLSAATVIATTPHPKQMRTKVPRASARYSPAGVERQPARCLVADAVAATAIAQAAPE